MVQLNIVYPQLGTQKVFDIDDDKKLCVAAPCCAAHAAPCLTPPPSRPPCFWRATAPPSTTSVWRRRWRATPWATSSRATSSGEAALLVARVQQAAHARESSSSPCLSAPPFPMLRALTVPVPRPRSWCTCLRAFVVWRSITGGNDQQGFPMMQGVLQNNRVRLLLTERHKCYRTRRDGERRRKSVRGCIVGPDLAVLNLAIVKKGESDIPDLTNPEAARPRRLGPKRANHIRKLFVRACPHLLLCSCPRPLTLGYLAACLSLLPSPHNRT